MTTTTLIGNLTADPELKFLPNGTPVANFTIAVNRREKDSATGEWKDGQASYFRCNVWRGLAETVAGELRKGQRVIAHGEIRIREYEKQDGSKASATEFTVKNIGLDLKWPEKRDAQPTPAASTASAWGATGGGPF